MLADTAAFSRVRVEIQSFSYQMAVTRQSFRGRVPALAGCAALRRRAMLALLAAGSAMRPAQCRPPARSSGLPVPRFVSLKSDQVNVRAGPTKDQEVRWVYTRAGLPVEITAEFENWRRIRDWEGAEGWVYHSLLSGKRTAVVAPTSKDDLVPLYDEPGSGQSAVTATPATRRARPAETLQRHLVPVRRQGFRRLDPAGAAVGRLSEREGGVS